MNFIEAVEKYIGEYTKADGVYPISKQVINGNEYNTFNNIPESLRDFFAEFLTSDEVFLSYLDESYTYKQTYEQAVKLANVLVDQYSVKPGDRVAIAMRNMPEWVISYVAIVSTGAIVVPLNSWWQSDELEYAVKHSGARVVIADQKRTQSINTFSHKLELKLIQVRSNETGIKTLNELIAAETASTMPTVDIKADDDVCILFTSGSSGTPKGAVSSNRSILSAVYMWKLLSLGVMELKKGMAELAGIKDFELPPLSVLLPIPLFHVTACHSSFVLSVALQRKIVMMYKWDVKEAMRLIEKERVTQILGVPTMSTELLCSEDRDQYDLSSLTDINAGGAPMPPEHVKQLAEAIPNASPSLGYGLTETAGLASINAGPDYLAKNNSVGKPAMPIVEVKILDSHGNEVAVGEEGEVCIKSASNIRCYWNAPEATAEAFKGGWFHTGDLGKLDTDGFLYIVGRIKEIIIRGGENISCVEVESAIYEHPSVLEATVFSVPDKTLGELVATAVVLKEGSALTANELQDFLSSNLASYKVPAHIWFHEELLPRLGTGKIFKRHLQKVYSDEISEALAS